MNVREVIDYFSVKYPNKSLILLPEDNPTEIICEIEPAHEHPEYSVAIAAINESSPHYHNKLTENYEVVDGELELTVDDDVVTLQKGDVYTINPKQIHHAKGQSGFSIVKVTSRPGWKHTDHVLV